MRRPPAVARVLERVTRTAREHDMFHPRDTVLVACSGGPDSVCLLLSLWHLRRLFRIRLEVFHFDHRLRADSAADAAYVKRLSGRLALPFHARAAQDEPERGASVEVWATTRRMQAADDVRRATGADVTAEGHTLDDHVETVLLNLFRGAGLEGLSGIWPGDRSSALVQPLLDVERGEVEAFCRALHLRPRRDPTNEDRRHLRNVIRLDVLPAIEHATGRDVRGPIARSAGLLSADRDELRSAALEAMRRVVRRSAEGIGFDVQALRSLPGPVAARAIRLALFDVSTPDDPPWTRDAIEAILDLAHGRPGRRRDLPAGLKARRDREYVLLSRTSPESRV